MFEDSTFESTGRIRTRSRAWMLAALGLNGSVVLSLMVIPLIYPEALPRGFAASMMPTPPRLAPPDRPKPAPVRVSSTQSPASIVRSFAAPVISFHPRPEATTDAPASVDIASWDSTSVGVRSSQLFPSQSTRPVVRSEAEGPVRVSGQVEAGLIVERTMPTYPAIVREAGVQGTVVLAATISKNGTIENLRVLSGPAMLQQAALDAVKTWRYRPYRLDGEPVEVETTINVIFTLGH
jgi:protein TonB